MTNAAKLFDRLDRELWLVTARAGPRAGGLIATFVGQASIVPALPRVLVGLGRRHYTHELVEASSALALHLLGEEQLDWVWRFGLETGRTVDKFAGLEPTTAVTGSPILCGVPGWLDCNVEATLNTGDRTVYLAEVVQAKIAEPVPLLTLHGLLQRAPPDKLQRLKELMAEDSEADAAAILVWRQQRASAPAAPHEPQ